MKTVIPFLDKTRIQEEAAEWVARLQSDPLTATERDRLKAWLSSSSQHREAFERLARLWNDMACMTVLAELFPLQTESSAKKTFSQRWLHTHAMGAATATLVGIALLLGGIVGLSPLWSEKTSNHAEPVELVYQTETGQQSEVLLKDGSILTLNTRSQARVRFAQHERAIYLTQGEAHFEVAKNPNAPFVVYAGNGQVRAIGTAFNVRLNGEHVGVLVTEGTVEVVATAPSSAELSREPETANTPTQKQAIILKKGGTANYTQVIEEETYLSREKLEHHLAWRKGKWMFEGETLAEVIDEVSRYTDRKIEIVDPRIADLRIGGYFDIGEIDALMSVLQAGFGIQVNNITDGHIQLSALDSTTEY